MPSDFAVLRLIDSIIFDRNSNGISLGGVPCKILPRNRWRGIKISANRRHSLSGAVQYALAIA